MAKEEKGSNSGHKPRFMVNFDLRKTYVSEDTPSVPEDTPSDETSTRQQRDSKVATPPGDESNVEHRVSLDNQE